MDYPKYQWSYFLDNQRNSQIVVRANDTTEMENGIVKALELIEKIKTTTGVVEAVVKPSPQPATAQPQVQPQPQQPGGLKATCSVHNDASGSPVVMKSRTSKTGNEYWAHNRKLPNGQWDICFGKGWMSEKE